MGDVIIGYRYSLGMHMGICRGPVDEVVELKVGDKSAWPFPEPEEGADPLQVAYVVERNAGLGFVTYSPETSGDYYVNFTDTFPGFWAYGGYVKIENLVRTKPTGGDVDLSGIYLIRGEAPFSILIDSGDYVDWDSASAGWATNPGVNAIFTYVQDAIGTPWPDSEATSSPGDVSGSVVTESETIQIDAGRLFKGDDGEGGIEGPCIIMMGEDTQTCPATLATMYGGAPQPGYRRRLTAFFDGLLSSMNPYPKKWEWRVRRSIKGWDGEVFYPELAMIPLIGDVSAEEVTSTAEIKAMNPAHMIYECLTNTEWGRGFDATAKINIPSFRACAEQLSKEGFGLCLVWRRSDSIEAFIQSILDHIGASFYEEPTTSKITLKLIRGDYVASELPLFDESSGLLNVTGNDLASGGTYINEVRLKWHDPVTNEDRTVRTQNLASIQASGGAFNSINKDYPGIPTASLAYRVAQRDLRAYGIELRRFTMVFDRRASNLRPGDVIRVRSSLRAIRETICRVAKFDGGTLLDGKVTLTLVQDVFNLPDGSFATQQPGTWIPPSAIKPCIGDHKVFELPYVILVRQLNAADLDYLVDEVGYIGTVVEQGQTFNASYKISVRNGAPDMDDEPTGTGSYCGYPT